MAEVGGDVYADFAINTLVFIIIILLIISAAPLLGYLGMIIVWRDVISKDDDITLLKRFTEKAPNLDMKYNEFSDFYLFSSYIPYKKLRICNKEEKEDKDAKMQDNLYLYKVNEIKNQINKIKTFCDTNYENIKRDAEAAIAENKANRINREHGENMIGMKESGKNTRAAWKSNLEWAKRISSWLHSFIEFVFRVWDYLIKFINMFIPVLKAIMSNQVITGYMVIIITIYLLFYFIKKAFDPPKEEVAEEEDVVEEGFLSSMYREYLDTLSYYNKLMKNVRIKDYTGGVLGKTGENEDGEEDDTVIGRPMVGGKLYDNLSYIVLEGLLTKPEETELLGTNLEIGKYYNVYLPEEKYKNDNDPKIEPIVKWKVSVANNKNNNEKKWKLDCESIDTIRITNKPAFISSDNKCIINENDLNDSFNIGDTDIMDTTIYKTEYIK
jgi:hypothetical protein